MKSEIIKNQIAKEKRQQEVVEHHKKVENWGKAIRYEMPSIPYLFLRLTRLIYDSEHRKKFFDISYYLETKNGHLKKLIPASEYYKLAFRAIADKYYFLMVSVERVQEVENELRELYRKDAVVLQATGQRSFQIHEQVYQLKMQITNILFSTRSILDSMATVMHFLYGPSANQFSSFADFVKDVQKTEIKQNRMIDIEMQNYIQSRMDWFFVLRDLRDYITHYGSIDVSFHEKSEGEMIIVIQDLFELNALVNPIISGLDEFFQFFDEHFANRIQNSQS